MNYLVKCTYLLFLSLLGVVTLSAQSDAQVRIEHLVIRQTDTHAELLNLNPDGSTTLIATLETISFSSIPGFEWHVPVAVDVAPSAQGQHVAFTAYGTENQTVLFLIRLNPLRIEQIEAPGIAALEWSPTGDAILLTRPSLHLGGESRELVGRVYVFDLATETFTLVAENVSSQQIVRDAVWSPDGSHVILNIEHYDAAHDVHIADLYLVNRDGTNRQQLTNLGEQAPQSINFDQPSERNGCTIGEIEWSASIGRLYYVLSCNVYSEVALISLFSVSLEGENRLEVDLFERFPEEFAVPNFIIGHEVINLFAGQDAVFLVVNSPTYDLVILSIDGYGQIDIIANIASKGGILAAINEDNRQLAISLDTNEAVAVDLVSNAITFLPMPASPLTACRVQWLDNLTILVDEVVNYCRTRGSTFVAPIKTVAWTPATGEVRDIFERIHGEFTLVIPLPALSGLADDAN